MSQTVLLKMAKFPRTHYEYNAAKKKRIKELKPKTIQS